MEREPGKFEWLIIASHVTLLREFFNDILIRGVDEKLYQTRESDPNRIDLFFPDQMNGGPNSFYDASFYVFGNDRRN